jgi:LmbE family N-acetylglucosaminyl deacetylase
MAYNWSPRTLLAGALVASALLPMGSEAQGVPQGGTVATGLLLRQLDGVKRVLMIGAHPDDEDTSLLAALSRRWGAQTAYLALTRGEGGQNLIGPELWEGLGIIRTGELEAARRLDGGVQFFTRALDFGYSKSADEALELWPREELLRDVVWVVRSFRPQIIVTVFSGTPADGHGQHQAAGIMAREAFEAAGDPSRFPDQLRQGVEEWTPSKLYQAAWRRPSEATSFIETGAYDPLLGRSEFQLSMESRSFHRSQDMGASQPLGPRRSAVILVRDRTGHEGEDSFFAGIDTTLASAAAGLAAPLRNQVEAHLREYRSALAEARASWGGLDDPFAAVSPLQEGLGHLYRARDATGSATDVELSTVLDRKIDLARRALLAAAGVVLDVRVEDDLVTPGQTVRVTAQAWNGGDRTLEDVAAWLSPPEAWPVETVTTEGLSAGGGLAPGSLATWAFDVTLPEGAGESRLYFLRQERDGYRYRWPDDPALRALPRDPAPVRGVFGFALRDGERSVEAEQAVPWSYVGVNPARGEFRRPVLVVPKTSVSLSPRGMVWPQGLRESRTFTVTVRSEALEGSRGKVSLSAPPGWRVTPEAFELDLQEAGSERSVAFDVEPAGALTTGAQTFRASVQDEDGHRYEEGVALIDYEHIERAALFTPAEATVTVVPVRVAEPMTVGYIMGTGDEGPEAIRQLGARVELVGPDQILAGDYGRYDAVVVGVRAYETRGDLRAANDQLLDYVRAGGTVVVQYNQYTYPRGGYAPYPVDMARPARRVADETAPVTLLEPDAPVFTTPNRISPEDFEGWVQERGLYFLSEWEGELRPMLEMSDPGEPPAQGALLVASVGEGIYVYTALSFFRQWSAGVPGAYRLFANLLSLDPEEWREYSSRRTPGG